MQGECPREAGFRIEARVASAIRDGGWGGASHAKVEPLQPCSSFIQKTWIELLLCVRLYLVLGVRGLFSCVNLPGTEGVQTFRLNIILGASVKVFLDEMNFGTGGLRNADGLLCGGGLIQTSEGLKRRKG